MGKIASMIDKMSLRGPSKARKAASEPSPAHKLALMRAAASGKSGKEVDGARGGRYYIDHTGKKVYLPKK